MKIYRISFTKHSSTLYATGVRGRFNAQGELVVYASSSPEGALLENIAHRMGQGGFMRQEFSYMEIEVPDSSIHVVSRSDLPDGWNSASSYSQTIPIGSAWYAEKKHLILQVPAATSATGINYLINTTHELFREVRLIKSAPYPIDHRLTQFDTDLKQYLKKKE
jgi:RES domain-containing protein